MNQQQAWYNGWAVVTRTFPGHRGRPGHRGGSLPRETLAIQAGGTPATDVLDVGSLPKVLGELAGRASYKSQIMTGKVSHAAGLAPKIFKDGSLLIPVSAGRKPSKGALIHEIVHAHQSQLIASDPDRYDEVSRAFEGRAMRDNKSARSPLWAESILGDGGEIWPAAAGFYYGGNRRMIVDASPEVVQLLRDVYEK